METQSLHVDGGGVASTATNQVSRGDGRAAPMSTPPPPPETVLLGSTNQAQSLNLLVASQSNRLPGGLTPSAAGGAPGLGPGRGLGVPGQHSRTPSVFSDEMTDVTYRCGGGWQIPAETRPQATPPTVHTHTHTPYVCASKHTRTHAGTQKQTHRQTGGHQASF